MNSSAVKRFAKELAGNDTSAGTIRFSPDSPLPAALVKKQVTTRIAEQNDLH